MRVVFVAAAVLIVSALADKPMDLPCVTWEPLTSSQNTDPTDLFVAAYTWVLQMDGECYEKGDIFPCFASDTGINTWGHHDYQPEDIPNDYCRTYNQGNVYLSNNMYVPKKGPQWQTWKWVLAQSGGVVPDNAIRYGSSVMARSTVNAPDFCCGKGFTGWAVGQDNGTFGPVYFSITTNPVITNTFEVAICEAYHPNTTTTTTTTTAAPTTTTTTAAPTTTPAPTPKPTLPPNTKPYIRFGHTIPTANNVFATISQGNLSYTWNNYHFGEFSGWVEIFQDGTGTIDIYASTNGAKGSLLLSTVIPLTPGPLVVVIKDFWPPTSYTNVETIAASYVPVSSGSGVRLFNLSPDTPSAFMKVNGTIVVEDIAYSIGSVWAPIPADTADFTIFNNVTGVEVATDTFTPPQAPFVFTNFLIGLGNVSSGSTYATRTVPLIDAPES
jgi:hypothetical protein